MRMRLVAAVTSVCTLCSVGALATKTTSIHDVAMGKSPAIASDSKGILHAAFEASENGKRVTDIFYTESSDKGKSWTTPIDVSKTPGISSHPDIAVEKNGAIDIVWTDTTPAPKSPDIFFVRSVDSGKTWTQSVDISNTPGMSTEPVVATSDNDCIHVVWSDTSKGEQNQDIYYTSSSDGGKKWGENPRLPAVDISNTPGVSSEPSIAAAADGAIHVAWVDTTPGRSHPDIFYAQHVHGTWSKALDISNSLRVSTHPGIAYGKGKTFLCWSDNSRKENAPDIWCDVASKNGKFAKPINISSTPGVSSQPATAANENGRVGMVWSDTTTGVTTPHIFARVSLDSCEDFSSVLDLSEIAGASVHPDVTIAGDRMVVIWETTDGEKNSGEHFLKATSLDVGGIATGPATMVDPTIHAPTGNMH
jgi:BNR repeat-like domain